MQKCVEIICMHVTLQSSGDYQLFKSRPEKVCSAVRPRVSKANALQMVWSVPNSDKQMKLKHDKKGMSLFFSGVLGLKSAGAKRV